MATGVVIRLQNLPLSAGTIDIRRFFEGLAVPDGGVHIIGGDDGTAFILFSTDEDARQAMMRDGQMLFNDKIKLRLSSHTEMRKLIEDSQRRYEELRGLRPPEPPITNLTSRSTATGRVHSPAPVNSEYMESSELYVELKNLPYSVTEEDLLYFFSPVPFISARVMRDEKGHCNGSGFAKFSRPEDKMEALKRDRNSMGPRFIRVYPSTERMWLLTASQPCDTFRSGQDGSRKRGQNRTPLNEGTPKRSRALSPLRYDFCVEMRGLPPTASYKTVIDFFMHFQIAKEGIFVELDNKICKGHAYVEFLTEHDFKAALLRDGEIIEGKQIRVIGISRQAMMDQIKLFKKYIKVKHDEEIRREYEEREKLKMIEEERKRKNDEEIARRRMKKQREMEEWLTRQHAKEEEDRKRLDLEKRIMAQEKSREEEKVRKQMQLEAERRKLEEAAKREAKENQYRKRMAMEKSRAYENANPAPKKDESMPMDLEDQDNSASMILTSIPYSVHSTVSMSTVSSTSGGYRPPMSSGTSGTMNHRFPPPPLPPVPTSLTGIRPGPPIMHSQYAPMVTVPPPTPPTQVVHMPVGMSPGIPPPSPVILNPPLPSLPPPPAAPNLDSPHLNNPVIRPPMPPSDMNNVKPPTPDGGHNQGPPAYIRVANSPWHASEDDVRNFFAGLNIAVNGIKFVSNKNGKRSGHIFIKFNSVQEAAKAALKDKRMLGIREVLVQQTNMNQMEEIIKKCSNSNLQEIWGLPTEVLLNESNQNGGPSLDKAFEQKILKENLTCVRLGNVPENVKVEFVVEVLRGISIVPGGIQILRNNFGKCVGEVYVELVTPEDCAKVSTFHGKKNIMGNELRVLPVSLNDMKRDLANHFDRNRNEQMRSPRMFDGPGPPRPFPGPDLSRMPAPSFNDGHRHDLGRPRDIREERPNMPPRFPSMPPMPGDHFDGDRMRPPLPRDMPPRFPMADMPPRFPMPDERMLPRGPGPWNMGMRHPMPPGPGFPFGPQGMPPMRQPVPIKMSNLNFNIKPDEILDFFARYHPIPETIRYMYHKDGKLTGEGVVCVPSLDAAEAAIKDLNGKLLLQRKIRLEIG